MNIRNAKSVVVTFVLVMIIAVSLVTSLPANHPVSPPVADSTNPQPQPTGTSSYIPRSEPARIEPPSQPVPQQVVIQFAPETTDAERIEYVESIGGTVVESIESIDTVILDVPEEVASQPLPQSAKVVESEQDYYVTALDDLAPVNDPRYAEQWALPAIGAPSAWTELPADAPKVTVAVIDSGICASHPDLAGRIIDGWDFLEGDAVPQDDFGHGCSVSGVIAANMNDGIGIAGVAPNAQIMPLRVLNASGVGSYSDVAAAIVYAADNGAQVINLSLGGSNPSSTLENAVNYAISKGMIVVAAAGNNGTEGALYPAAYPDVISVGSVDPNLQHSSFSNYGSQIDIWAPGRDILTTKRDGSYGLGSGTSFAVPYVTGAEAVITALGKNLLTNASVLNIGVEIIDESTPTPSLLTDTPFPTITQTNTSTPDSSQFHMKTYRNLEFGFAFLYPENSTYVTWETASDILSTESFFLSELSSVSNINPLPEIAVTVFANPSQLSIGEWKDLHTVSDQAINSNGSAAAFVDSGLPETITIDGDPGLIFLHRIDGIQAARLLIQHNDNIISITMTHFDSGLMQEMFTTIVSSFDFDTKESLAVDQSLDQKLEDILPRLQIPPSSLSTQEIIPLAYTGYKLPWPSGISYYVSQNWGTPEPGVSHNGYGLYAYDFGMPGNSSVSAARTGKVVIVKGDTADTTANCGGSDKAALANRIVINHSDGKASLYLHLMSASVAVDTNNDIPQGTVIGKSGRTGWTNCGYHLHFQVQNQGSYWEQSQEFYFDEYPGVQLQWSNGNITFASQNQTPNGGTNNPPAGFAWCGNEGGRCNFSGTADVVYGALNSFTSPRSFTNGVECNNSVFGDPISGMGKACYYKPTGGTPSADHPVQFYLAWHYEQGYCYVDSAGWGNLDGCSGYDKNISSVLLQSGWSVRVYKDRDLGGTSRCFTSNDDDFSNNTFDDGSGLNDQVSSFNLYNQSSCPPLIQPPPAPTLSTPGNGSSNPYNYDLNFQWNSSSGATEYFVEWWGGPYGAMQPCGWSSSTSCHIGTVASGNTYFWHVKARNSAGESSWGDTWTFTIQSNLVPDLVIQSITASPSNPSINQPVTFTVRVKNQGTGNADTSFFVDFFIDNSPGACPSDGITWWQIASLAAGATQDLTYTYSGFSTSGTHNVYAFADSYCDISESNDSNNTTGPVALNVQNPQPPPAPSLTSPGNGSSNPYNYDLNFQWNSSSGATEYIVEWWGGPYSTMQPCGWSSSTSCHIGTVIPGNTYSWHVKARNSAGESNWSNTWTFTIQPNIPSTPSNFRSSNSTPTSVTIAWDDVSNETGYKIYKWNGSTVTFEYLASVGANVTSYTETRGNCGWDEYYEVSAYNGNGESAHANWVHGYTLPCTPTLSSPGNGSSNPYNYDLNFQWNSSSGATEYLVEWWGGPYNTMQPCGWSSSTSCQIGTVIPGNTYSWHVKARNSVGESNWSDTSSFSISVSADTYEPDDTSGQANWIYSGLTQTRNIMPATDTDWVKFQLAGSSAITLETSGSTNSDTRIWLYNSGMSQLEYSDDEGSGLYSLIDRQCGVDAMPAGTYYVKIDEYGNDSEISSYGLSLATSLCLPTVPVLASPLDGATLSRTNDITLTWTTDGSSCSVHVVGGNIDINPSGGCSNLHLSSQRGGAYTWQVTSNNAGATTVGPVWHFNVRPYAPTSLLASVASSTQVNLAWTLSSDEPADVDSYDVYKNGVLLTNIPKGTVNYSATGLTCNTSYSFYLRAKRQGVQSDNSNTVTITPPCPPAAFNKSSPANAAVGQPIGLTLSWAASTGASGYEYCIDTTSGSTCDTSWVGTGTAISVTVSNLAPSTMHYWQVRAVNSIDAAYANTSAWWSFTTGALPGSFTKISPSNNSTGQPVSFTLSWAGSAGATSYKYCFDTTNDNACGNWVSAASATSTIISGLNYDTTYYWHVQALNAIGVTYSDGNTWRSFTTGHLPGGFNKNTPANLATSISINPTLSWFASTSAASYEYCVSTTSAGCTTWVNVGNQTSVNLSNLAIDTTYYWNVRAVNTTGTTTATDAIRSFTTVGIPSIFVKSAPANSTTVLLPPNVTLTWGSSAGVVNYEYCLDTTNDSACQSNNWINANTSTSVDLTGTLLANTTYYWQVRAINTYGIRYANGGTWWAFKTMAVPVAPVLALPITAYTTNDTTPAFSWNSVPAGNTYMIQIDNDSTFTSPVQIYTTVSGAPLTYEGAPLADGAYYWRVKAINVSNESGVWSASRTFIIDTLPASAPLLSTPADNGFTALPKPTLGVLAVTGATRYQFQVSAEVGFGSLVVDANNITTTSYTLTTALPYGRYYWRALAVDAAGNLSAWSAVRSFTVTFMSAPIDGGFATTDIPTFTWTTVTGALEYHLQVDETDSFAIPELERYQSSGTTYISLSPLDYGIHYWRMQVRTAVGWSSWTPAWRLTLTPPLATPPALVNPANAAFITDNTPDLTWNMVLADDRYQVQVDNLSTFTSPEQIFTSGVGALTYTATTLPDGVWYWRVRTINYLDVPSVWSAYRSFTVDTTGPVAPALSAPANAASVIGTPAFSWTAAATATKYQFEYDNNADFSSPTYTSIDLTTTSHTPPAMALSTYSWHVRGKDAAGNWGAWSTARTVTILPLVPVAPVLVNPAASAVMNDSTPDFAWNSVVSGNTYQLEVSNASTFATKQQTFAGGVGVLTYTATTIPDGVWYWHVRALNVNGVAGAWSAYRSFTVDTTGPVAPTLSAPANAASVIGTPAFSWATAATATKYQFEYDNDSDFSSPTYASIDLTTTSHTPPAIALGTYSWRVRGKDAAGNWGAWSATRTVTILPLVPVAPTLLTPAASAVTSDSTPDFNWNSVVSGNTYQLEISNASTFATKQQTFAGGVGVLTYAATTIPDGVWYWHVRALNVNGVAGAWSAYRSFTVDTTGPVAPVLSAPANAASVIGTPAFSWAAAATATKYQFEYDNDADFSSPTYTSIDLTTTSHTPPAIALGTYSWHVRGKDVAGNWGAWSTARIVTILPLVPVAPVLVNPAASAVTNDSTPDFSWNSVVSGNTYELEISNASTFATKQQTFTGGVGVLNYTATNIPDGVWYWHVRALNVNSVAGAWSAYRSFTVDTTGPVAPTLSAPANAASVIGTPAFSWTAAATATKYQFEYDNDADFSSPTYTSIDLTTTSHTPPTIALGTYSWHVRGKDAAGNWGAWSTARTVTILPAVPVAPTLATPAASAVTTDSTPDFTWNSVVSGNTYQLEISNASTFATKQQTFTGGVGVLNYTATTIPDGVWYWHVRALNVNGVAGAWSAYRSFTVDTTGPVAPTLTAPVNAASVNGTPAFSWAAAATATKYQFEYDNDVDFSSPTYTSADLTTTSHTPPAMAIGTYSWHVRGKDAAGNWGAWSTTRIVSIIPLVPATPTLTSPANGSISQDPAPALNWTAMPNAASYQVQMDNNSTFSSPEFDGNSATNTITPTSLADGIYYWRVRQTNILGGTSLWSTAWRVTISQPIPAAPNGNSLRSLELPTSDTGLPTFNWSSVEYGMTYQLQVADNETFTDPIFDDTAETTDRTLTEALAIGEYFWRVRAINEYGTAGPWSETWSIMVDIPPAAPTLLLPSESAVSLNGEASFSWQGAENAEKYQIQVDNAEDFSSPEFDDTAIQATRELLKPLTDGTYFWRVRGLNIYDTAGEWSDVRSFTVSIPPAAPTLLTPEVDSADETGLPAFEWEAVLNGATYQIQVDNNADFSSPEFDDTAETITRELATPLENGIYYWRVRAIKADDTLGEWSLVWNFMVNVP